MYEKKYICEIRRCVEKFLRWLYNRENVLQTRLFLWWRKQLLGIHCARNERQKIFNSKTITERDVTLFQAGLLSCYDYSIPGVLFYKTFLQLIERRLIFSVVNWTKTKEREHRLERLTQHKMENYYESVYRLTSSRRTLSLTLFQRS